MAQPAGRAAPKRVLLVDDNADAVAVLSMYLRRAGHEIHHASDGADALDAVRRVRPDVVFLDLGLPRMNGFEVARHIRRDPALAHVRVIALTGYAQDEGREEAREAGIEAYLVKPVDLAFIDSLLGR